MLFRPCWHLAFFSWRFRLAVLSAGRCGVGLCSRSLLPCSCTRRLCSLRSLGLFRGVGGCRSCFSEPAGEALLLGAGLLAAGLPWICIRYWMLSGPLLGVVALCILTKRNQRGRMALLADLAVAGTPMIASLALFAWFDAVHFGTLKPNAGYFFGASSHPQFFRHPEIGFFGLFLDRAYGLLPIAPIYLVSLAGAWVAVRRNWRRSPASAGNIYRIHGIQPVLVWGRTPSARYVVAGITLLPAFASLVIDTSLGCWYSHSPSGAG